jgi:hypothetical protein
MFRILIRGAALSAFALSLYVSNIPAAEARLNCGGMRSQCVRWCNEWTETWTEYYACRDGCLAAHGICVAINAAMSVFVRETDPPPPPTGPKGPGEAVKQPGLLEMSPVLTPQAPAGAGPAGGARPPAPPAVTR